MSREVPPFWPPKVFCGLSTSSHSHTNIHLARTYRGSSLPSIQMIGSCKWRRRGLLSNVIWKVAESRLTPEAHIRVLCSDLMCQNCTITSNPAGLCGRANCYRSSYHTALRPVLISPSNVLTVRKRRQVTFDHYRHLGQVFGRSCPQAMADVSNVTERPLIAGMAGSRKGSKKTEA